MRKTIALILVVLFVCEAAFAGLGSNKAMYVGGTLNALKEKTEGKLTLNDKDLLFEHKAGKFAIPYENITSLEYGQKAGRRVGATIGMAAAVGIFAAPMLFSKKRKHYLTVGFNDENGKPQAAVIELGKETVKPTLEGLEAKTGKKVEYQDEEAKKSEGKK
jgi:hypothetical protein